MDLAGYMDRIKARMKKSSRRRGDKTTLVRRYERPNAAKHNNYDAASSSSSSADSVSSSLLMTHSLEFPDRTSFQIRGVEGELDKMYQSLGISGPDDLGISSDAWNRFKSFHLDNHKAQDLSQADPSGVTVASGSTNRVNTELTRSDLIPSESNKIETSDRQVVTGGTVENRHGIESKPTVVKSRGCLVPNDAVAVGGGIKGVRPPVLKPPPAMKPPLNDHHGSSWGFLHFDPVETAARPMSC